MEKQGVPMQQYPKSPDVTGQPPVYAHDPNAAYAQQQPQPQQQMYTGSPPPAQQYAASPPPQDAYSQAADKNAQLQPGMPPQQPLGTTYQNATPIVNLGRGAAPADCPACGQRAMTNTSFETGNTTHAWAFALCCFVCLGCIPYLMSSMKDVAHKCGSCGVLLATWHRSGNTEVHIHS